MEPEIIIVFTEIENLVLPVKVVRVLTGVDAIASRRRISHLQTIPARITATRLLHG